MSWLSSLELWQLDPKATLPWLSSIELPARPQGHSVLAQLPRAGNSAPRPLCPGSAPKSCQIGRFQAALDPEVNLSLGPPPRASKRPKPFQSKTSLQIHVAR